VSATQNVIAKPKANQTDPSYYARISEITNQGIVTVKFSRPLMQLSNISELFSGGDSNQILRVELKEGGLNSKRVKVTSWKVLDFLPSTMRLQVTFDYPQYLSMNDIRDQLVITFLDNQYFIVSSSQRTLFASGTVIQKYVPP
jgi:hypothetical protein